MRILFFGDVVGEIGLRAIERDLSTLKKKLDADFVIVNGENTCKGSGLTYKEYEAFVNAGVDCITLGNHWHGRDQIDDYIQEADHLVRPLNLKGFVRGEGSSIFYSNGVFIQVTNILGQAFMKEAVDDPIESFESLLDETDPSEACLIHFVDFHADSTSEKKIFVEKFAGRVSAVIGTHTHVQTADETIINGTGYLTDCGYCGAANSIIGYTPSSVLSVLVDKEPGKFKVDIEGPVELDCVLIEIDENTGRCLSIEPMRIIEGKEIQHATHDL